MLNKLHLNNVVCNQHGMYISGLRSTKACFILMVRSVNMAVELPPGTHNAQPFRDGVLFNDSEDDVLRYTGRGEGEEDRAMAMPQYNPDKLTHKTEDQKLARAGFARGLCPISNTMVCRGVLRPQQSLCMI